MGTLRAESAEHRVPGRRTASLSLVHTVLSSWLLSLRVGSMPWPSSRPLTESSL